MFDPAPRTLTFTMAELREILASAIMCPSNIAQAQVDTLDERIERWWFIQEYRRAHPSPARVVSDV